MFRQVFVAAALLIGLGAANAQDASQIESVRAGQSCSGCNLFQANLAYLDLPNKDFSGSRLRQADLSLSTMNYANFEATNLSVANMFAARFTGANFKNADLTNAVMVGTYLGGANFTGAKMTRVNLSGAEMATAKGLTQAQLDQTCGDEATELPPGLRIPSCQKLMQMR